MTFIRKRKCASVICNTETSQLPSLWLRILDINWPANEANSLGQHLAPVYR
jgi:hypothetical protein